MARSAHPRVPSRVVGLLALVFALAPAAARAAAEGDDAFDRAEPAGGKVDLDIFRFQPPEGWNRVDEPGVDPGFGEPDADGGDDVMRGDDERDTVSMEFEPPGLGDGERVLLIVERERVAGLVGAGADQFRAFFNEELNNFVREAEAAGGRANLGEALTGTTSQGFDYITQGASFWLPESELYATVWAANADGLVASVVLVTSTRELYDQHVGAVTKLLSTAEFRGGAARRPEGDDAVARPEDPRPGDASPRPDPHGPGDDDHGGGTRFDDEAYPGTYEGDGLALVIKASDNGPGTLAGTLTKGERSWPIAGVIEPDGRVRGSFEHEGNRFKFTAELTLDGDDRVMRFASGKRTYMLRRHDDEPVNPLDEEDPAAAEPANPLDQGDRSPAAAADDERA